MVKGQHLSGGHMATTLNEHLMTSHSWDVILCPAKLLIQPATSQRHQQAGSILDAWNVSDVHMAQMSDEDGIVYLCGMYWVSVIAHGRLYARTHTHKTCQNTSRRTCQYILSNEHVRHSCPSTSHIRRRNARHVTCGTVFMHDWCKFRLGVGIHLIWTCRLSSDVSENF